MRNIEIINGPRDDDAYFGHLKGVAKSIEFIEQAIDLAEAKGGDFSGITIKSSRYHTDKSFGFVIFGRPIIYLQGMDLKASANNIVQQLRGLYNALGMDESLAERAGDIVELTAKTLLHERGHLKTFGITGNYTENGFDSRFREYVEYVGKMRSGGLQGLSLYEIGEWIAEDYRLLLDFSSPYPHKHAAHADLQLENLAGDRRKALKEALGL
ncbi:MAG: hypothetical protein COW32_07820 [Candidatus Aquicultor secundus]|uniref:Uncharacterized protein n=1 Tax=Candidatus Aquicultor secundus TaxID=1973895 RepID=A0A2M7TAJ3_9ACTN|nr:hypothetical protein [Candidatus Aquicultor secundus]NCO66774.1 hypothetical protein [Solirubrobacter sp.]OIO87895.1 MAG: hypothetical protein AUK32_02770 [Candidatus Aquicultor secundus]PIU26665.1 MAG: hypothetical protein COT10_07500 [Candidatus Aquicultor secundus]PIW21855.1 MAG: hypothetical protein COW32_07820 [Candidatus Aquicultor secundus]PIX52190.1 MAG: hypothetical protein COZ51_05590 [Candidatus Aquicultor secundus]